MAANAKPIILYDNRFEDGTITATDTESGYDVANIKDLRTYTWWRGDTSGTKYITVDCGSAEAADALGIIGHNLNTASATLSVEYSSDDFSADINEALAGFTPSDDYAFLKIFTTQSARYWRLKIVTASVEAKLAVVILGERLTFERYLSGNFSPVSEKVEGSLNRSKQGHILGAVVNFIQHEISANFQHLTPSWVTNTFKPAWDAYLSQIKPFFWAWEITNHGSEIYFVSVPDNFKLSLPYDPVRQRLNLKFEGIKE